MNKLSHKDQFDNFIQNQKKGLWLGAGASADSLIPFVYPFLQEFFQKLNIKDEKVIQDLLKVQFEVLMEEVINYLYDHRFKIFSAFDNRLRQLSPNHLHHWMIEQIQAGLIRNVLTTNFDTLIEDAIEKSGVLSCENLNVNIYNTQREGVNNYNAVDWGNSNTINIIKPHGCITNPDDLVINIQQIVAGYLQADRKKITQDFLSQDPILMVGYGMNDHFDITPYIQNHLKKTPQEKVHDIYFLNHNKERNQKIIRPLSSVKNIRNNEEKKRFFNPFINASSKSLWIDGYTIDILSSFSKNIFPIPSQKSTKDWKDFLHEFEQEVSPINRDLTRFVYLRNHLSTDEKIETIKKIEQQCLLEKIVNKQVLGAVYDMLGEEYNRFGKKVEALSVHKKAEKLYMKINDFIALGNSYHNQAKVYQDLGDRNKALALYDTAKEFYEKGKGANKDIGLATVLGSRGNVFMNQGKYGEAFELYKKSREIFKRLGKFESFIIVSNQIGYIHEINGQADSAIKLYEQGVEIAQQCGFENVLGHSYGFLGNIYRTKGKLKESLAFYNKAYDIYEKLDLTDSMAISRNDKAYVLRLSGKYEEALNEFEQVEKIFSSTKNKDGLSGTYNNQASIYQTLGDLDKAFKLYEKAKNVSTEDGNIELVAIATMNQGLIYQYRAEIKSENYEKAMNCYLEAKKIVKSHGNKGFLAKIDTNIANVFREIGEYKKSIKYYDQAEPNLTDEEGRLILWHNKATALEEIQDPRAEEYYQKATESAKNNGFQGLFIQFSDNYAYYLSIIGKRSEALICVNNAIHVAQKINHPHLLALEELKRNIFSGKKFNL